MPKEYGVTREETVSKWRKWLMMCNSAERSKKVCGVWLLEGYWQKTGGGNGADINCQWVNE